MQYECSVNLWKQSVFPLIKNFQRLSSVCEGTVYTPHMDFPVFPFYLNFPIQTDALGNLAVAKIVS